MCTVLCLAQFLWHMVRMWGKSWVGVGHHEWHSAEAWWQSASHKRLNLATKIWSLCLKPPVWIFDAMIFNLHEQWFAGRNGHVCGRWRGVEGKRKLLSDRSPVKRANSCYPACQISFFSSAKSAFFPGNVRSRILRQFPEGTVQEVSNVCGSPGHDETGIEGGASWRSRQGLFHP